MKYLKLLSFLAATLMISSNGFAGEDVGIAFAGPGQTTEISAQIDGDQINCTSGEFCQEAFDRHFPAVEDLPSRLDDISLQFTYSGSSQSQTLNFTFGLVEIDGKTYRAFIQNDEVDINLVWVDPRAID